MGTYLATVRERGSTMTREQLDEVTRRYLAATFDEIEHRLALDWDEPGLDAHRFDLNDEAHRLSAALRFTDYSVGIDWARAMLPDASAETLRKLSRRLIEAKLEAVKAELRALAGAPLTLPIGTFPAPSPAEAAPKDTPQISEVATMYGDERVALRKWSPRTEFQHRKILEVISELLGDPQIGKVTKADIRALGQAIGKLPSNMSKRFPGMTPREILERTEGDASVSRLEPRSVNKYQQMTRSLFAWATEHDHVKQNPAGVMHDVKEGKARDDRKPFTDEDIVAYMAKLPQEPAPAFLYWIPRILAYSGLRLGEVANLRREDVREERGIWVFDVNEEGEDRQLKTGASRRLVPIHPRLEELGLITFAQDAPTAFLWPIDMRTSGNPERGPFDKLSKLLGRRLRAAGVKDEKKTGAHSFRHTVSAKLKAESVPDYQISDLLGHEDDSMSTGRYGKATDVSRLSEVVKLLRLPI